MVVHTLIRIDSRPIGDHRDEIRAFMTLRDEMLRLPQTIDYHRKMGVVRFFAIDNGSLDGTREFLLAQPDCHVFVTHNSYSEASCGVDWQNALLKEYGVNHWCLVVDADEWFVYPGCERRPLSNLAAYLDRSGAQGMLSFLLDMYGPGTVAAPSVASERSLLDMCHYFDGEYSWHRRFYIPGAERPRFPAYNVVGGPRWRLLFPVLHRYHYLPRAVWHVCSFLKIPLPLAFRAPPALTKIPFVRWLPGTHYQHAHATTPIKLSDTTGVLLHFKFLDDFDERISTELNRKVNRVQGYWADDLTRYYTKRKNNASSSFHYAGSIAYESSDQLIRLGLLREDQEWMRIRSEEIIERKPTASVSGAHHK
jgi:hypothetical protein